MSSEKLVRDRIPERMRQDGGNPIIYTAKKEGFSDHLKAKLREEVEEFCTGPNYEEEIADIFEVIDAFCKHLGLSKEKIEQIKRKKAREKGKFTKRFIWKWD